MCAFANDFHNLSNGYIDIGVEEKNGWPVLLPKGIEPDNLDAIQQRDSEPRPLAVAAQLPPSVRVVYGKGEIGADSSSM